MTITTDRFLSGLKRRITLPAMQVLISDSGLLEMADDVIRNKIAPVILSVNQNYFLYDTTQAVTGGVKVYPIPPRSIGRGLRDLKMRNGSVSGGQVRDLSLIALEDEHLFRDSGVPSGFYFKGDRIVLVPTPSGSDYTLIIYYNQLPGKLVLLGDAAQITSIVSNVVTTTLVPSIMGTGSIVDFISGTSGNSTLGMDKTIAAVLGSTIVFTSADDIPSDVVPGDFISLATSSPVLQIPDEAHPLLETLTAARVLYAIGDFEGEKRLLDMSVAEEKDLKMLIQPRIEGESTKIINRRGLLRGRSFNSWRVRGGFTF